MIRDLQENLPQKFEAKRRGYREFRDWLAAAGYSKAEIENILRQEIESEFSEAEIEEICGAMVACPDYGDREIFALILEAAYRLCGLDRRGCKRKLQLAVERLKKRGTRLAPRELKETA